MRPEPTRYKTIGELVSYIRPRFKDLLAKMKARGFDPVIFETYRSPERQCFLYGKGRTAAQCKRAGIDPGWAQPKASEGIVTYTLHDSKHLVRKAADIISASTGWSDPKFFAALKEEAEKVGLHTLGFEGCHVEWRG